MCFDLETIIKRESSLDLIILISGQLNSPFVVGSDQIIKNRSMDILSISLYDLDLEFWNFDYHLFFFTSCVLAS